jgi:sarcosine oxidase, subunit gamma
MADTLLARHRTVAEIRLPAASGRVLVTIAPATNRLIFRGDTAAAKVCGKALGLSLPLEACRATAGGGMAALWLGPDEWLLMIPDGKTQATNEALERAMAQQPHSLVDVSHRQVGLIISGPDAEQLLGSSCLLDLDIDAFPVGMCTRTIFGKAEITLWRTDVTKFHVEVWRSFADYVAGLLTEAAYSLADT